MRKFFSMLTVVAIISAMISCESETGNAVLQVYLTDAPGDYDEVNVDIAGVAVHTSEGDDESGWKELSIAGGVYNLLELTNGLDTLLGSIEIPAGRVSQIRLKLGDDNSIVVDGKSHKLITPSGMQSGLKLQVHQVLAAGITYRILLDFDAARSIVETGNGSYKLKPVIRTITEAQDGAISGIVEPAASTPAVYAISGIDTVGTSYADDAGEFMIRGLPAGSYSVSISPNSDYTGKTLEDVGVTLGQVTDVGIVTLAD